MRYATKITFSILVITLVIPGLALAGSATLHWQANTEPDLAGYRIYYGTSSRSYGAPISVDKNTTSYTLNNLTDGQTYYFALTAVDTSGNESGYSQEVSKAIPAKVPTDSEAPVVVIKEPSKGGSYVTDKGWIGISGTASDNVGITGLSWSNSRGGSGSVSGMTQWSVAKIPLKRGENIITVTATDKAGNKGQDSLKVTYKVVEDTQAPVVVIKEPTNNQCLTTSEAFINLSGSASDNTGVSKVTWANSNGGKGIASGKSNWFVLGVPLIKGTNLITVTAIDLAGNKGNATLRVNYVPLQPEFWSIGVVRRGRFYLDFNRDLKWGKADKVASFDLPDSVPITGDWNGDGRTDIGAFWEGKFYLDTNSNGILDSNDKVVKFGLPQDTPITGDWNGDGVTEIGVKRKAQFYLDMNGNYALDSEDERVTFGFATDIPITGDWNGDGITEIGVKRGPRFYLDMDGNFIWDNGDKSVTFGFATDIPVTGDWNGDGITEIGVKRGPRFYLDFNGNYLWDSGDKKTTFGLKDDAGVVGKW